MLSEQNADIISSDYLSRIYDFIEARKNIILIALCLLFAVIIFYLASQKLFWNDELYTLYFARVPAWPDLWRALSTGADQIPPTFVLITKLSISLFGANRISLRLPEIAGFLVMSFCLYRILSIRTSAMYGFLAMLFPTMTAALAYSYEARGYGLVLGFSALAFYCWQSVADHKRRNVHLVGLGASLSGALMSHYYGILLFFPFVIGELVRARSLKKVDFPVWITFAISAFPLVIFLPLIQASASYGSSFWAKPNWSDTLLYYDFLLQPIALLLLFVLILMGILQMTHPREREFADTSFRTYELAAALAFVIIPPLAVVALKLMNGALTARHVLLSIVGFSILVSWAIHHLSNSKRVAAILLLIFFVGFLGKTAWNLHACREGSASYVRTVEFLRKNVSTSLPIVSWYIGPAQEVWYYGPSDLARRVFYLADADASIRYLGHDTIDRGMMDLKPWFPTKNVQSYGLFQRSNRQFLLYYCAWEEDWKWNWIVSQLLADRRHIELTARQGDQYLYLVSALNRN